MYEWFRVRAGNLRDLQHVSHFIDLVMQDSDFFTSNQRLFVNLSSIWFELLFLMVRLSKPNALCYGADWFDEMSIVTRMGRDVASFVCNVQMEIVNRWFSLGFYDTYQHVRKSALLMLHALIEKHPSPFGMRAVSQWIKRVPHLTRNMPLDMFEIAIRLLKTKRTDCIALMVRNSDQFFDLKNLLRISVEQLRNSSMDPNSTPIARIIQLMIKHVAMNPSHKGPERADFFRGTFRLLQSPEFSENFPSVRDSFIHAYLLDEDYSFLRPHRFVARIIFNKPNC